MALGSDPEVLLASSFVLDGGLRVRLRLARSSDAASIQRLIDSVATERQDLLVARLVHYDPRRRGVLCATALVGGSETLIGVGAIDLDYDEQARPEILVVDREPGHALTELL